MKLPVDLNYLDQIKKSNTNSLKINFYKTFEQVPLERDFYSKIFKCLLWNKEEVICNEKEFNYMQNYVKGDII